MSSEALPSGYLRKVLSADKNVVVIAADLTPVASELMRRQGLMPPSLVHLGQACLAAALLQALSDPDENQRIELQWRLNGPFGNLFAESLGTGQIRGTIGLPQAVVERLDESLGTGLLQVRRSTPPLMEYTGIVESGGHVGTDLVEYLERSEQKTCGVSLSVQVGASELPSDSGSPFFVRRAVGYLVHVLPQPSEATRDRLLGSWHRFMEDLGPLSKWQIESDEPETVTETILHFLMPARGEKALYADRVRFHCPCTEERAARALALLQRQEAAEGSPHAAGLQRLTTVTCEFCGQRYDLSEGGSLDN